MDCLLLDKKNAALMLGISTVSLDRIRKSGKLPFRQIGGLIRFLPQDIDDYIHSSINGLQTREAKNESA